MSRHELITWSDAVGAVTAPALAIISDATAASARARLAAAERAGLMRSCRPLADAGALYVPTRAGLREFGLSGSPQPAPGAGIASHSALCAVVAARLQRAYPRGRVIGEAALRRLERACGRSVASAELIHGAEGRSQVHRPDLVLWAGTAASGLPMAVEVELTVKGAVRLSAICRAWARAHCVAGVIYLVSPEAAAPVAAAVEHANAAERVSSLPLAALEGADSWLPALERTVAVRA